MKQAGIWAAAFIGKLPAGGIPEPIIVGSTRNEVVTQLTDLGLELNRPKDEYGKRVPIENGGGNIEWVPMYTNTLRRIILYSDTADLISKILRDDFLTMQTVRKVDGKYRTAGAKAEEVA